MQVQQAYDNWRRAGQRMEQLGHEARAPPPLEELPEGLQGEVLSAQIYNVRIGKLTV